MSLNLWATTSHGNPHTMAPTLPQQIHKQKWWRFESKAWPSSITHGWKPLITSNLPSWQLMENGIKHKKNTKQSKKEGANICAIVCLICELIFISLFFLLRYPRGSQLGSQNLIHVQTAASHRNATTTPTSGTTTWVCLFPPSLSSFIIVHIKHPSWVNLPVLSEYLCPLCVWIIYLITHKKKKKNRATSCILMGKINDFS